MGKRKRGLLFIGFVISVVFLAGCGEQRMEEPEDMMRVSIIYPHSDDGYWSEIEKGILKNLDRANENGIDVKPFVPQLNYNVEQMTQIVKQQIAAKVDAIVVQGNMDTDFLKALQEAHENNIQIICMDTDLLHFPEHLYVGTNNYEAGYLMGRNIGEQVGEHATLTIMSGEPGYPNLVERIRGLKQGLREYPGITIQNVLYDNYDSVTFMEKYRNPANGEVLVCIEGTGALTLSRVFSQRDDTYKHIYGFDLTDSIPTGVTEGILMQDTENIGSSIMEELIHYKMTGSYSSNCIYTDITWVTRENYASVNAHE